MLLTASLLTLILGLVHSVLGEVLIFNKLRQNELVPSQGGELLKSRQLGILWASWHLVSVFGWGIAAILANLAIETCDIELITSQSVFAISIAMLVSAMLVLIGTRGKHPGWIVLTLIGVITLIS